MEENKKKTRKFSLQDFIKFIKGQFLLEDFLSKHWMLLLLIVGLTILFITNGYTCQNKLAEIDRLNLRLKDVKYENQMLTAKWTSNSRHSQVKELLEQRGLNLSNPASPAVEIHK